MLVRRAALRSHSKLQLAVTPHWPLSGCRLLMHVDKRTTFKWMGWRRRQHACRKRPPSSASQYVVFQLLIPGKYPSGLLPYGEGKGGGGFPAPLHSIARWKVAVASSILYEPGTMALEEY